MENVNGKYPPWRICREPRLGKCIPLSLSQVRIRSQEVCSYDAKRITGDGMSEEAVIDDHRSPKYGGLIASEESNDQEVSTYQLELPGKHNKIASKVKKNLEHSNFAKFSLLFAAILGTSLVIGDGILTPSISGDSFIVIWKTNILLVILYVLFISSTEYIYVSVVPYKFGQGGYLPVTFVVVLMFIMCIWNYVYRAKYNELDHKVSLEAIKDIVTDTNISHMEGHAIFYFELAQGIPPIFKHYVNNVPALHSVIVFVSIKSLTISRVAPEERGFCSEE
ncbi:potassium transporter 21-like [Rutidosis leptorrhynchoides]|uniref:potassium transporter 21-like n=1 Tax=Rutidosis leptorrhynchoides TaxID=125765 RepID=UPI003A9A0C5A